MTGLITLTVIAAYLVMGARYVMPFAKGYVRTSKERWSSLYTNYRGEPDKRALAELNREAVWVGIGKSLFWPYVLLARWVTDRLVNNLTAEERKAAELKDARRIIAEYEAEQFAKAAR